MARIRRSHDLKTVVILFVAHDGVANPLSWEWWRSAAKPEIADRIRFAVFRNSAVRYLNDFGDTHDLRIRMRTEWGSERTVMATVASIRAVLESDCAEDIGMLFVVSGNDVPLQHAEDFFRERTVTTEGVEHTITPYTTIISKANADVHEALTDPELWPEDLSSLRSKVMCHNTFMALSRAHTEALVKLKPEAWEPLIKMARNKKLIPHACPEEWLIGTALNVATNCFSDESGAIIDWPLTDSFREKEDSPSPITWGTLDEERTVQLKPHQPATLTLRKALKTSRDHGHYFFRKVAPLSKAETEDICRFLRINRVIPSDTTAATTAPPLIDPATRPDACKIYHLRARQRSPGEGTDEQRHVQLAQLMGVRPKLQQREDG